MAVPSLFNPIKKPIQTGVVWAFWQQVTWPAPKKVPVKLADAIKPAIQTWVTGAFNKQVTPQTVAATDKWIQKQKAAQQAEQQRLTAEQAAMLNQSANTFKDLYHDINKGTDEELLKAYPELWWDASILKEIRKNPQLAADLYWDLQKPWVTQEKIQQAYPEIYGAVNKKWWVLNYLMGMGKQSVSTFGTNLVSWALDLVWADKAREKVQGFQQFVKWEEEASLRRQWYDPNSKSFKAGETTSNIALSTAPTLITWWAGLWAVKSISNPILRWAAGAAVWWAQWLASTNLAIAGSEWRKATATENIIWWWLWAVIWWVSWYRSAVRERALWELFDEKAVSSNIKKAASEWRIKFTEWVTSRKWSITPTERVSNGIKIVKEKIKWVSSKDPQKVLMEIKKYGAWLADDLSDDLSKIKVGTMTKFKAALKNQIDEVAGLSDEWTNSQVKQITNLKNKIPKAKTANDLWKIRQERDALFSQAQKNLSANPAPSTAKANRLRQSVRKIMNDNLDELVQWQLWPDVKGKFYDMSSLYEATEVLTDNMPDLVKQAPTMLMKWLKWAGKIAAWYGVWEALKSLWQ